MSTEQAKNLQEQDAKKGLWADISSDEDESEPEKQESDNEAESKPKAQQTQIQQTHNQGDNRKDKQQQKIKSFNPKQHLRGGFGNMKTVKGGFKPEKLQKKKFHLAAVKNPFDLGDDQSQEQQTQQVATEQVQKEAQPESQPQQEKKQKQKNKKKDDLKQFEETLKQLGLETAADGQKKKKKKKAAKKPAEQIKESVAPVQQAQSQPVEDFQVDKQKLQEIIKQKAKKPQAKKKVTVNSAALRAKQERQAKNKTKKVHVDL